MLHHNNGMEEDTVIQLQLIHTNYLKKIRKPLNLIITFESFLISAHFISHFLDYIQETDLSQLQKIAFVIPQTATKLFFCKIIQRYLPELEVFGNINQALQYIEDYKPDKAGIAKGSHL